jgi:hypothetical protein
MPPFTDTTLSIDENGIDLLRNRFAYRHLNFHEIEQFRIEDGHLLKNWWIIFAAGFIMLLFAFKLMVPVLGIYSELPQSSAHPSAKGIAYLMLIPFSLIGIGGYFVVQSLRRSKILVFKTGSKLIHVRIREIDEAGYLRDLTVFLEEKIRTNTHFTTP